MDLVSRVFQTCKSFFQIAETTSQRSTGVTEVKLSLLSELLLSRKTLEPGSTCPRGSGHGASESEQKLHEKGLIISQFLSVLPDLDLPFIGFD